LISRQFTLLNGSTVACPVRRGADKFLFVARSTRRDGSSAGTLRAEPQRRERETARV